MRQAAFQVRAGGGDQDGVIPWEILEPPAAPPVESRADAPTVAPSGAGAMQDTIVGRVFADTAAAYLGVRMPVQESGDNLQVVIGDGATGATKAKGDGQDAEAASLEVTSLPPRRLTARYVYRVEDKTRLVGLGEALRADLTGALGEALDAATLNGDGSGVNPTGFFAALDTPDDPSEASGMADLLAAAAAAVDGRYALTLRDVRSFGGQGHLWTGRVHVDGCRNVVGGGLPFPIQWRLPDFGVDPRTRRQPPPSGSDLQGRSGHGKPRRLSNVVGSRSPRHHGRSDPGGLR